MTDVFGCDKTVVFFGGRHCAACHQVLPLWMAEVEKWDGLTIQVIDAETSPLTQQLMIRRLPTILLVDEGSIVEILVGVQRPQRIRELVQRFVA